MIKPEITISRAGGVFNIIWPSVTIPKNVFEEISKRVRKETDYNLLNGRKLAKFGQFINNLGVVYECDISLKCAISIRNVVLKDKIIRNYTRMNKMISKMSAEYNAYDILKLSVKYDFPPLNLLRGIFLFNGIKSSIVYDIFANRKSPDEFIHGRDLNQFKLASKNDAESSFNQSSIAKIALDNETLVVNYFTSEGIQIKTQEELVREQIREYGRAVATPDILFIDPVFVNGQPAHWIDYKDYTCTNVSYIYNSNLEQALRYVEKWGPGVLCYRYGTVANVQISNTQLLSAEYLPIKFIE